MAFILDANVLCVLLSPQSCEFVKKRNGTVLRVVWNGDLCLMSSALHTVSCRRWFFTINGKECSHPRTIDTQLYVNDDKGNWHRPAYGGYCFVADQLSAYLIR